MPATALTVVELGRGGVSVDETLTAATVTVGESFVNDGKTFFNIVNGAGAPINFTVTPVQTIDGQAIAAKVVVVAATGDGDGLDTQLIGPYTKTFEQTDGTIVGICSSVTTVTIGAFRLP